jgi:glycerophosphoryl diester phosphodiesterase
MNSKKLIDTIIQSGFEYHSWTVDDSKTANKLLEWGASSIATNRPGYLRQQLL